MDWPSRAWDWIGAVVVAVAAAALVGREIRRRFAPAQSAIAEHDEWLAQHDVRKRKAEKPEWERRLRRLWFKGERKRLKQQA